MELNLMKSVPIENLSTIREGLRLLSKSPNKTKAEKENISKLIDWFSEENLKYRIEDAYSFDPSNIVQAVKTARIMTGAGLVACRSHVDEITEK